MASLVLALTVAGSLALALYLTSLITGEDIANLVSSQTAGSERGGRGGTENGPSVLLTALAVVGLAGLIALPAKFFWDEAARREEQRRNLMASTRERVLRYYDGYYIPLQNRLEWVFARAALCEEAARAKRPTDERHAHALELLYDLARFQSVFVWALDHGIVFLLRTLEDQRRIEARLLALQQQLGPAFDSRLLAGAVRKEGIPAPPELEVSARMLTNVERSLDEFKAAFRSHRWKSSKHAPNLRPQLSQLSGFDEHELRRVRILAGLGATACTGSTATA